MRRSKTMIVVLGMAVATLGACSKGKNKEGEPAASAKATEGKDNAQSAQSATPAAAGEASAEVGVQAGGIQRDDEGPAAVITNASGTVEVRRVGETEFAAAKAEDKLYAGDTIRTAEGASATVTFADESVAEVAEVSSLAVASRHASADPASGAAVLSGLSRFTVTPRAPGEGAFRAYTSAGIVLTKGTVYAIGVAASGEARVGVESGAVDVIGLAQADAPPVEVQGGAAVTLEATGNVATPAPWPQDDWGTWRDEADAKVAVDAAIAAHGDAMTELHTNLKDAYADLEAAADASAKFEASAATAAEKSDTATYEAAAPEGAATIEASFSIASRVEALTWALAARAALAHELYVRHPAKVETQWQVVAPRYEASLLWPKRFEVTATGYLEPLRTQYYVHHPRGRVHAQLVGVAVPEFYAKLPAPRVDPARVRARAKTKIWLAPELRYTAQARPVWITAPSIDWRAKVKVRPAKFRANGGWYVRPATLKGNVLLGGQVAGKYTTKVKATAPEPRANLRAAWKIPVGMKVKVAAPDLDAAARARAAVKLGAGGRLDYGVHVRDHRDAAAQAAGGVRVDAPDVKGAAGVQVRDHRDAAGQAAGHAAGGVKVGGGAKATIGGGVKVGAGGAAQGGAAAKAGAQSAADAAAAAKAGAKGAANAAAGIKIKAPTVKPPEVKVKGQVKAKGGIKIGN